MIVFCLISFMNVETLSGQRKNKKKGSKQERTLQKFELQKKALKDTSCIFQASKIKMPFVSIDRTGGYLYIESNEVRIQELDWPEDNKSTTRINEIIRPLNYRVNTLLNSEIVTVSFEGKLGGINHYFTIEHRLNEGSELTIVKQARKTVKYSGRIKLVQ